MRRRRNSDRKLIMPEISLTPLIDTALTLLVIFMVSTPMLQNAINVELPKTGARENNQPKREDLIVYIDSKENFYLGDKKLTEKEIAENLGKRTTKDDPQTVYVRADRAVKHGTVCEFVDRLQHYPGVKNVALATQITT
jgi:biopolymer transport protein ExbD